MIKSRQNPQALVGWMESLADRTRLRLLRVLESHELGVAELCDILQLPQSTVSRHLKVLADQQWVHSRREATTRLYRTILDELEPTARKLWIIARDQTDGWATVRQDELRLVRLLRGRETGTQAFFAGAAGKWDKLRRELYGQSFTTAALLAALPADYIVADLGCGTGQVTAMLAPHVQRVIGIDNSAAMLKAARKRLGDRANVDLLRGDLASLPLDDSSCDVAMLLLVLTYLPDLGACLRESHRILKPAGKLVIVDLLPHDRDDFRRQMGQLHAGFEPEQLTRSLREIGFTTIASSSLPPERTAKGPALFVGSAIKP